MEKKEETITRDIPDGATVHFRARDNLTSLDSVELFLAMVPEGRMDRTPVFHAEPVIFKGKPRTSPMAPILSLNRRAFQMLVDDLWTIGVRPRAAQGSAGQLDAVQAHLNDMRDLVFKYHTTIKKGG